MSPQIPADFCAIPMPSEEGTISKVLRLSPADQVLVLTVLHVPNLLDSGPYKSRGPGSGGLVTR